MGTPAGLKFAQRGAWLVFGQFRRERRAAAARRTHAAIRPLSLKSPSFFTLSALPPYFYRRTAQADLIDGGHVNVSGGSRIIEQRRPPGCRGGGAPPPMVSGPRERDGRELLRQRRRRRGGRLGWHR